jgi:TolB-like protein/Flp pilus assembly protein TadD
MPPLAPSTRLGPYEVVALLGAGGMGEVYRAHDGRLGRDVALKVLPAEEAGTPDAVARLEREARLAAALSHPNICTLYDVGEDEGRVWLAFELLDGSTLRAHLDAGKRVSDEEIARWGLELADALAAAHDAGIVHRDLKPENVFVTARGAVKVLDFGIARRLGGAPGDAAHIKTIEGTIGAPGAIVGTPSYLSPEQARGLTADARTDLFAVGALLYEVAAGRRAFTGRTIAEIYDAILNREPAPLTQVAPARPAELGRIVARALEKDPDLRYQGARDLKSDLLRFQRGLVPAGGATAAAAGSTAREAFDPKRVLAVLPFRNLAGDGGSSDFFAAGITEEILGQLSRLSALRVLARNSTAGYDDAADGFARLAAERGVGSVVTGSVRLAGSRVRIAVQLVEARSGRTLWSEQYDRELEDVFAVQSDVALRIAGALKATLSPDERSSVERAPTDNMAAYQLYLRSSMHRISEPEGLVAATELLRMAVHLAPDFAMAWARLSRRLWFRGMFAGPEAWQEGRAALEKALELAPEEGFVHFVRAGYLAVDGHAHAARRAHLRGIELDPNNYWSMSDLAYCEADLGRFDDAFAWAMRAFPYISGQAHAYYHVVLPLLDLEEGDLAARWLDESIPRFPNDSRLWRLRGAADLARGDRAAAEARLDDLAERFPRDEEVRGFRALATALLGRPELLAQVREPARRTPDTFVTESFATTFRVLLVRGLQQAGDEAGASAAREEALNSNRARLDRGEEWPNFVAERAMLHALGGDRAGTLEWLERAGEAGFRRGWTLDIDPTFDLVRDDPRYVRLREGMRADVARMRERANATREPLLQPGAAANLGSTPPPIG